MKILLMGHNKWACLVLRELIKNNYDIIGVVTETDDYDKREAEAYVRFTKFGVYESLKEAANTLKLPVYKPKDVNSPDFIKTIEKMSPNLIVIVSYHGIIKKPLLRKFKNRIINAHVAPLPYYRGRAPINWAIINGEDHVGVTVHFLTEEIDAGPIILQEKVPITENDRAIDVLLRSLPIAPKLILRTIKLIENGQVKVRLQNPFAGSYFPKRTPADGLIDWRFETSREIHDKVRALTDPYPGAFTFFDDKKVVILKTSLPKERKRITPVLGLVFGKTPSDGVKTTTIDDFIIIEKVKIDDTVYKGADYFKMGARLGIDLFQKYLLLKDEIEAIKKRKQKK